MKKVFILTELVTKHMFAYTLRREQDKNEVFSGFLKEAKIQSRSGISLL